MPKMKEKKDAKGGSAGRAPKHALDKSRPNKESHNMRSAATVRRLKMYSSGRAVRDKGGKIISQELQSKDLPSTRVVPDRRWFGNTRVIGQRQLSAFREQMADKANNPFSVLLRQRKLPMQLLEDTEAKADRKRARRDVLQQFSFAETFGAKSSARQKRPRLAAGIEDLAALVATATGAAEAFDGRAAAASAGEGGSQDFSELKERVMDKGQSKRIWGELYKVVDSSDVIIQVLDARDPEGTRSRFLERHIRAHHPSKHLILLLNKVDLVPGWAARRWLHTLGAQYPTLAFHASLTKPFGKGALLSLLRQLARLKADRKAIAVGFIGYPNVGKSSVINTLRTKKVCTVAPVPGETKVWQYVTLTKRVYLVDCPGVVHSSAGAAASDAETVLRGVVRIERLEDPAAHIPELLRRIKPGYLRRAYKVEAWDSATDFLEQVARLGGRLGKGGEADTATAARMVLLDWQKGKLPYFTLPPDHTDAAVSPVATAAGAGSATVGVATALGHLDGRGEDADCAVEGSGLGTAAVDVPLAGTGPEGVALAECVANEEDSAGVGAGTEARQRLARHAATKTAEQAAAAIPMRSAFFDREDLGPDAAEADQVASGAGSSENDDGGASGSLEGGERSGASWRGHSSRSSDNEEVGTASSGEDEESGSEEAEGCGAGGGSDDEDCGYGAQGLSWRAVMAEVLGASVPTDSHVCPSSLSPQSK